MKALFAVVNTHEMVHLPWKILCCTVNDLFHPYRGNNTSLFGGNIRNKKLKYMRAIIITAFGPVPKLTT